MVSTSSRDLDPLDLEIVELAFDGAWAALMERASGVQSETEEALKAILRRELVKIARFGDVSDPEALRDMVLATLETVGTRAEDAA
jgi:hypothetical protein